MACQGLGIRIAYRDRLLGQSQRVVRPGVKRGLCQTSPPDLISKAEDPAGLRRCQPNQPVASPFFRSYSGSGPVIQRFRPRQMILGLPQS